MSINRGFNQAEEFKGLQDTKLAGTPKVMRLLFGADAPIAAVLAPEVGGEPSEHDRPGETWQPRSLDVAFASLGLGQEIVDRRTELR